MSKDMLLEYDNKIKSVCTDVLGDIVITMQTTASGESSVSFNEQDLLKLISFLNR